VEVLITVKLKRPRMNEMQKLHEFLEVVILKGVSSDLSPA